MPAALSDEPLQTIEGGYIVQLGVFVNYANAESFLGHIQGVVDTAQYHSRVRQRDDGKYRVFIGPYQSRAEAQQVADYLGQTFGLTTYLAPH
ncbi:MAG: SPOR domain-containing protein [Burkholderiales bacterium]|nr:SPOR domain-containing protein [Burkholderiales bacterium]